MSSGPKPRSARISALCSANRGGGLRIDPGVRESFAGSIKLVIAQALVGGSPDMGRVACFEILKATLAVVKRETQSWRYPLIMAGYLFAMAYLASFLTYQIAVALGAG